MQNYQWTSQDYLYVVAECLVGMLSVLGNSLVLVAIGKTRALQTVTNCFIASLATADTLVGLVLPPAVILPYRGLPHNFHGCVLINTVVVLITNISILSLLAVALERYLAISDPFRYTRVMSIRRALWVVAVMWVVAIVLGLAPTLGWNLGDVGFQFCSFVSVIDMSYMVYLIFFGVTLPPLVLMLLIYLYIFSIVRKQQRAMVAHLSIFSQDAKSAARKQRREVRGAKGLAYVIVLFAVCWLPIHVLNCVTLFAPEHNASLTWHLVAIVLSHANSVINPFLYAFSNSHFKRAMLMVLFCGRCRRCYPADPDDVSTATLPLAAARKAFANGDADAALGPAPFANSVAHVSLYPRGSGVLNRAFSHGDKRKSAEGDRLGESLHPPPSQPGGKWWCVRQGEGGETETTAGECLRQEDGGVTENPAGECLRQDGGVTENPAGECLRQGEVDTECSKHNVITDFTARRPVFVVSVGDPSPAPPLPPCAPNAPGAQLGSTQTSVPPPDCPHVLTGPSLSDAEPPQHSRAMPKTQQDLQGQEESSSFSSSLGERGVGGASSVDPLHSPLFSDDEEVEVTRSEHGENEKVERLRLNSASVTAQFVNVRVLK